MPDAPRPKTTDEAEDFDKFEELANKLLQVSKDELDHERAVEHAEPKPA